MIKILRKVRLTLANWADHIAWAALASLPIKHLFSRVMTKLSSHKIFKLLLFFKFSPVPFRRNIFAFQFG